MAKRTPISMLLLASMTFSSVALARNKFVPPADIGTSEEAPYQVIEETQSAWGYEEPVSAPQQPQIQQPVQQVVQPQVQAQTQFVQPVAPTTPVTAATETVANDGPVQILQNRPDSYFAPLRYVDIRDIANSNWNKVELSGTATLLMRVMAAKPQMFVGPAYADSTGKLRVNDTVVTKIRYLESGARGPAPVLDANNNEVPRTDANGNVIPGYNIDPNKINRETIENTILNATIEGVREIRRDSKDGTKISDLQMLLFVNEMQDVTNTDGSIGKVSKAYFRRILLRVDWTVAANRETEAKRIQIFGLAQPDIPLSDTKFEVKISLLDRKIILQEAKHLLYMVYPVGVGSFDIRTDQRMEFFRRGAQSNSARPTVKIDTMTGEFKNAVLTKASVWRTGTNVRSRIVPSYYSGRPFIAVRRVQADGSDPVYTGIGMHFRISTPLRRAFISHGCLRVDDKDLYQIDTIVNDGPNDMTPIQVLNDLNEFYNQFNPMMPTEDTSYSAVVYTQLDAGGRNPYQISCANLKFNNENTFYPAWAGACNVAPNSSGNCPGYSGDGRPTFSEIFHTVADDECLTKTAWVSRPATEVLNYFRGLTDVAPYTNIRNFQHAPYAIADGMNPNVEAGADPASVNMEEPTNESGTRQDRGNLFDILGGMFGGGNRNRDTIVVNQPSAVLTTEDRVGLKAQLDQQIICVNSNTEYFNANNCSKRNWKVMFPSQEAQNCKVAYESQASCRERVKSLQQRLGL